MSTLVKYTLSDSIATIQLDDENKNVISPAMIAELNAAFDRAAKENAIVILTGRENLLSAGFDLKTMRKGGSAAINMLIGGFKLLRKLLAHPTPIIVACNGHAVAMGCFILQVGDYRIGRRGDFKIAANEVAIGMTIPHSIFPIVRDRLKPACFNRSMLLAENFSPESAHDAGLLDELADTEDLMQCARAKAEEFKALDLGAHKATKLRARKKLLRQVGVGIFKDRVDIILMGLKAVRKKK